MRRGGRPKGRRGQARQGEEREEGERPAGFRRGPWIAALLGAAFFLSGGAGLVHEVVWVRLLGHVFGVTAFAVSTVLAAYMGGLALGSYWIGRRAARLVDPPRVYALLEIGIGAFALALPLLLDAVEPLYGWIWRELHVSFAVFSALRFVIAGALLLAPTIMMGATLPVLAEYLAGSRGARLPAQWLYTVNLAGAVIGVAVGGFVLLPSLGLWGSIVAGALVNVGIGAAVLFLAPKPTRVGPGAVRQPAVEEAPAIRPAALLVAAAFLSGFTSMATQTAWTRVLVLIVGSTTYAFSTVLLVYLIALATGSALASWRGSKVADVRPDLGAAHLLMALGMLAAIWTVNSMPTWYWQMFSAWRPETLGSALAVSATVVFLILIGPVLFAGMILPLTMIGVLPPEARGTGKAVGAIYAVNTAGAILGAILGGFVLVPLAGSQTTLLGLALVVVLMGSVLAVAAPGRKWLTAVVLAGSALVVVGVLARPDWDQKTLNAAVFEPQAGVDPRAKNPKDAVLYHREGATATVMVLERGERQRYMRINGRINASTGLKDVPTNVLLSQIPLLLAPRREDVFIVGLASGVTAGAALQSPARRVTVVELEPAVVEACRFFDDVNHRPLEDSRLTLHQDDARHVLAASRERYDVIISEPPHPWISGVANLFTQDFFALAAGRLRDDGVFAQWLQTYQIAPETFLSLLATFQSVYPEVLVFGTAGSDLILIGSRMPGMIDLREIDRRWSEPMVRAEMARVGLQRPEFLLASLYTGPADVRTLARDAPINTDDNMLVEFRAPLEILMSAGEETRRIFSLIDRTAIESVLVEPDLLLGRRDRLLVFIEALAARGRSTQRYEEILLSE